MALSVRMMEGFAVAALAQGDADGAAALPGLAAELASELSRAMRGLATADPAGRRAFLRAALARPALDPAWAARLSGARFRATPELMAYLAQRSRAR